MNEGNYLGIFLSFKMMYILIMFIVGLFSGPESFPNEAARQAMDISRIL